MKIPQYHIRIERKDGSGSKDIMASCESHCDALIICQLLDKSKVYPSKYWKFSVLKDTREFKHQTIKK